MEKLNAFYMAGTEGTGEYVVLAKTARGRIGIRVLEGSGTLLKDVEFARIRVEPTTVSAANKIGQLLTPEKGWKQPGEDDQNRFSTVVKGSDKFRTRVVNALKALGAEDLVVTANPDAPKWAQGVLASAEQS